MKQLVQIQLEVDNLKIYARYTAARPNSRTANIRGAEHW